MHTIIILASVLLPLIGVMQMEGGAFGNSIGMHGYPNGASVIYVMYAAVLLGVYFALRAGSAVASTVPTRSGAHFGVYAKLLICLFLLFLLVMLLVFGGWEVWLGQVGKGKFRAHLGQFGAVAYLLINSVIPLLMAYASVLYRGATGGWRDHCWLAVLFGLTLLIGSTWGFKSTGITMLLPALIVLLWGSRMGRVLAVCSVIALTIVAFFYLFDSKTDEAAGGPTILLTRLTTLQGDVSWLLWNQYSEGASFPSYLQTMLVFVGDRAFSIMSGMTREMPDLWADYHFDILIGQLAGLPLSVVNEGHSIVGTPFADGLVLGGVPGVLTMALFAGLLCGVLCTLIEHALRSGHGYSCALLVTYFGIYVVTFLRSGVAVQLIHVASVGGLLMALALCVALDRLALVCRNEMSPLQKS
ncbi:hypothetical protein [Microvirgula aerodenitrificans]|uniref:hypothetical protein n=1 Tax=Microvirgula aerodenitrificans TaxID=57480 RepID=UPI00248D8F1A|nr:hypothetical protein [Microvirgula aerodenitrificans]